jgi:hypothetical protein
MADNRNAPAAVLGMRKLTLVGVAFCAVSAIWAGCGGDTTENNPSDAGAGDATLDALPPVRDSGGDAVVDAGCAVTADITQLDVADASISPNASTGTCSACVKTTCDAELAACNDDCDCKTSILELFDCLASGQGLQVCGQILVGSISGGGGGPLQPLGLCLFQQCQVGCGIADFLPSDGGADGDSSSTSDAASDAADSGG